WRSDVCSSDLNAIGECRYQFSMRKMGNLLLHLKRLSMLRNYLKNMDQMFGLSEKPKIYYQKTLHILEVQMVNLQKKQISWMFGLTLVLLMKPYYVIMMA